MFSGKIPPECPVIDILKVFVTSEPVFFGFTQQSKINPDAGEDSSSGADRGLMDLDDFFESFDDTCRSSTEQWATSEIRIRTVVEE
jgi:hypothetical protein